MPNQSLPPFHIQTSDEVLLLVLFQVKVCQTKIAGSSRATLSLPIMQLRFAASVNRQHKNKQRGEAGHDPFVHFRYSDFIAKQHLQNLLSSYCKKKIFLPVRMGDNYPTHVRVGGNNLSCCGPLTVHNLFFSYLLQEIPIQMFQIMHTYIQQVQVDRWNTWTDSVKQMDNKHMEKGVR